MAKLGGDNVGARSRDGIQTKVGITYLPTNRTAVLLPLEQLSPTDPEEMVIEGEATYTLDNMFKKIDPKIEVSLKTGDEAQPFQDAEIRFRNISEFEPDKIVENVPLLRSMREQQALIQRVEQLMQEGLFQKMLKDKNQKAALVGFLRSIVADIEAYDKED